MENFGLNITQIKAFTKSSYKEDQDMLKSKIQTLISQNAESDCPEKY